MLARFFLLAAVSTLTLLGQSAGPAFPSLEKAFAALRERNYLQAIVHFQAAVSLEPDRADIRKDLGYTYLKTGEPVLARKQFAQALELTQTDQHLALEYAFLCNETGQQLEARHIFDRIRRSGNATAEQAFQNIDRPLAEGIARWTEALRQSPENFSAHTELARLAEQREESPLAAVHYRKAWLLRPDRRELLLHYGRVQNRLGKPEDAHAALLAASRGAEPRVAEAARELLPGRYPFVYEFDRALALDPTNVELRREFAYLHLAMGKRADAEAEFTRVIEQAPEDALSVAQLGFLRIDRKDLAGAMPLLERALKSEDEELTSRIRIALKLPPALRSRTAAGEPAAPSSAKSLADKSFKAGYLKDALRYLKIAHEDDPIDFSVMLKLGYTYNVLKDDRQAVQWFALASRSPDSRIAGPASEAFSNLRPGLARFRTTVWMFPFYSSRWQSAFSYGQVKTEWKLNGLPFRPYLSARFVGDSRSGTTSLPGGSTPLYLSETSFIIGAGIATVNWKGLSGWAEAGQAVRYLKREDVGRMVPDYRAGLNFSRSFGQNLGAELPGWFFDTNADVVFLSRFGNNTLGYSQNRAGYTFDLIGPLQFQLFVTGNMTGDVKRQPWANFYELGPAMRFRFEGLPRSLWFQLGTAQGRYLLTEGNAQPSQYTDYRAGLWYAFTR